MNITVQVQGATYQIPATKVSELIAFLERNKITTVLDSNRNDERDVING